MRRSFSSMTMSGDVLEERRDLEGGERRLALALGVERAHAHEPVDAVLGAQQPVGVAALHHEGGRARCRPRSRRDTSSSSTSKPAALGPAQVHAQQHVGPVLGVGAALAGLDLADRVALVVLAGEEAAQLEGAEVGGRATSRAASISAATESSASSRASSARVSASSMRALERVVALEVVGDRRQLAGDRAGLRRRRPTGRGATPRSRAGAGGPGARRS